MKAGKLPGVVEKRSVFMMNQVGGLEPAQVASGEGADGRAMVLATDQTGIFGNEWTRALRVGALFDRVRAMLAAQGAGGNGEVYTISLSLPPKMEETELKKLVAMIAQEAQQRGIAAYTVHAQGRFEADDCDGIVQMTIAGVGVKEPEVCGMTGGGEGTEDVQQMSASTLLPDDTQKANRGGDSLPDNGNNCSTSVGVPLTDTSTGVKMSFANTSTDERMPLTDSSASVKMPSTNTFTDMGTPLTDSSASVKVPSTDTSTDMKTLLTDTSADVKMPSTDPSADVKMPITGTSPDETAADEPAAPAVKSIVMAGYAALEATAVLISEKREILLTRLAAGYLAQGLEKTSQTDICEAARIAAQAGAVVKTAGEGGVFGALWELGEYFDCGMDIVLRDILLLQETIEVCEVLDVNPYMLTSGGCILAVTDDVQALLEKYEEAGIVATVIGNLKDGHDRVIHNEWEERFLEPFRAEELYRVLSGRE